MYVSEIEFAAAQVGLGSHSTLHFMPASLLPSDTIHEQIHVCTCKCNAVKQTFYSCLFSSFKQLQGISSSSKGFFILNSMKTSSTQELKYLRMCELEINFDQTNLSTLSLASTFSTCPTRLEKSERGKDHQHTL